MAYKPRVLNAIQLEAKRRRERETKARRNARNAAERQAALDAGFGNQDINEIPPQVFARGVILREMMRTPACMWPAEWTEDL